MSAPDSVVELAHRRMAARNKKEFELADVLRNTIAKKVKAQFYLHAANL